MTDLVVSPETFSLQPRSFQEAKEMAEYMAKSDMVPKDYKGKPANVLLAVQMGSELGLKPLQALQGISCVNGRPCVWGDALHAIVISHPEFESIEETDDGTNATCTIKRKGHNPIARTFSVDDAKTAGLFEKGGYKDNYGKPVDGIWKKYPKRMRQMRARAYACRDAFADALKGIQSVEEVRDYEKDITDQVEVVTTPSKQPENISKSNKLVSKIKNEPEQKEKLVDAVSSTEIPKPNGAPDASKILSMIGLAKTVDDLDACADWARELPEVDKKSIRSAYSDRKNALSRESLNA